MKYNHAYTIAFSLESNHPKGDDVTPDMYRTALLNRIKDLDATDAFDFLASTDTPYDTYEVEKGGDENDRQ